VCWSTWVQHSFLPACPQLCSGCLVIGCQLHLAALLCKRHMRSPPVFAQLQVFSGQHSS
jgi:hypothetical protein